MLQIVGWSIFENERDCIQQNSSRQRRRVAAVREPALLVDDTLGAKGYHNSPRTGGRNLLHRWHKEQEHETRCKCNCSLIFNVPSTTVTGVFIDDGSPTRQPRFSVMPPNCQIPGICRGQLSTFTPERPKAKPLTLSYAMFVGPLRQTAFTGPACSSLSSAPRFGCCRGLALGPRDLRLRALGFTTPEDLVPSGVSVAQLRRKPLLVDAFGKIRWPRSRWPVFTGLVAPSQPSVGRLRSVAFGDIQRWHPQHAHILIQLNVLCDWT